MQKRGLKDVKRRNRHVIIQSIMDLSRSLDIPVIVEGVETEEQVQMMRRLGAEYAQGFYFYRPMSPDAFTALIDG